MYRFAAMYETYAATLVKNLVILDGRQAQMRRQMVGLALELGAHDYRRRTREQTDEVKIKETCKAINAVHRKWHGKLNERHSK